MKIGVFAYNWSHYKTQQGIFHLSAAGYPPEVMYIQSIKELPHCSSNERVSPRDYDTLWHPFFLPVDSHPADHDHESTLSSIKKRDLDLGIVLGARILKQETIDCFNVGVLNMHPGIIPINRGLDTLKWAVMDNIKQGVTTHLIDGRVDMGKIIATEIIPVYEDDYIVDVGHRLFTLQMRMMLDALDFLIAGNKPTPVTEKGRHHSVMDIETESLLLPRFEYYKRHYDKMGGAEYEKKYIPPERNIGEIEDLEYEELYLLPSDG